MRNLFIRVWEIRQRSPVLYAMMTTLVGVLAGLIHKVVGIPEGPDLMWAVILTLFAFTSLVAFVMFTIYRILQRLFRKRLSDDQDIDERVLFRSVAFYAGLGWGVCLVLLLPGNSYGWWMLSQSMALAGGVGLSILIKK